MIDQARPYRPRMAISPRFRHQRRFTAPLSGVLLLTGTVTPWVKLPGQTSFTEGSARPTITDNAFTWSRKANKKAYVYITHGAVKSNTITIAAR
jgi:hypothetical protein